MSFSKSYYKRQIKQVCKKYIDSGMTGLIDGYVSEKRFMRLIDKIMKDDERITWDEFFSRCGLATQ
jgi:hypothetical protein